MAATHKETKEIVPRYYGLSFKGEGNIRVFDNPSTAAIAYIAITSPDKQDGLTNMLRSWQIRKPRELAGEFGYDSEFKLTQRQANKLLKTEIGRLVDIVRNAIHKNHGSYNLWDCSGSSAIPSINLLGETLIANVTSQRRGTYSVNLKGAIRGAFGGIRYTDVFCDCDDNRYAQAKGGQRILTRRNCLHIKEAETDSYLQDTRVQHHARRPMKQKEPHKGERSLTFNFVDDPFLSHLIIDVLIAREVLRKNAYEIDRKLLTQVIGPAIMGPSLQEDVASGKAAFEILRQKMRKRKIDPDLLKAQEILDEAFYEEARRAGYRWQGHCLELGCEAYRYENPETNNSLSLVMNTTLPFYVTRNLSDARTVPIFAQNYGPKDPFNQVLGEQRRIDDKTRKETKCRIEPAVRIKLPEVDRTRSLKYDLPKRVISAFKKAILKKSRAPRTKLRELKLI